MVNIPNFVGEATFLGKDDKEVLQFYFRQHWIRLLFPFLRMVLWTLVIIIVGYIVLFVIGVGDAFARHGIILGLFLFFLLVQWRFLIRFYAYALYVVIVTDRKIHRIKKTLLTYNDHQTIDIWTLQDIDKSQHGVIQHLFNYGSIILEAQDTKLKLHFIPKVNSIYELLSHVRERARERSMPHNFPQKQGHIL